MNEKVTSYYTWMNQANHQNLPTYIEMWEWTIFCGHMQSSITLCQSSLLCFGKAEVISDSDHVSGPTGLEEMVHSDPVCSQVGSPSSYNRHMGSYAKPVSLFQLSYCFSFCAQLPPLVWPSHHPRQPDLWHHLHPAQWAHQDRIRYTVTRVCPRGAGSRAGEFYSSQMIWIIDSQMGKVQVKLYRVSMVTHQLRQLVIKITRLHLLCLAPAPSLRWFWKPLLSSDSDYKSFRALFHLLNLWTNSF